MKRKRSNPTKAELEAQANYEKMMARWDKIPKFSRTKITSAPSSSLSTDAAMSAPPGRETVRHPSRVTSGGDANFHKSQAYTGTKVLGIATLHKSISQPVFSQEEAIEVARMRRS